MSNNINIDKLIDDNYETWCLLMKSVLITNQVWSVIGPAPEEKSSAWCTKDDKALALITLNIHPKNFRIIKDCASAYDAWSALKATHTKCGPASLVSLFKRLVTLRISEGQRMQEHIDCFMDLCDQLSTMKLELPEVCLSVLLLVSLGEAYESFVVAMSSRDELPSVSVLKIKLLEEEERKQGDVANSAHVLKIRDRKKYNKRKQFKGKCFDCNRYGHMASQCPEKSNGQVPRSDKAKPDKAFQLRSFEGGEKMDKSSWILDSGATSHVCCDASYFSKLNTAYDRVITLADERKMKASGIGVVKLQVDGDHITLYDVLYVPELEVNYLSVSRATSKSFRVVFVNRNAKVINTKNQCLITFRPYESLFVKRIKPSRLAHIVAKPGALVDVNLLHRRLGHVNIGDIEKMMASKAVTGIKTDVHQFKPCETCLKCKASQLPYSLSTTRATRRLELIHSDLCGPISTASYGGARYFATFVDDYTRYVWVYPIQFKDEVVDVFKTWQRLVERQTGEKLKILRTDGGREYFKLKPYFRSVGIRHENSCPRTPQQNGVAERINRTLVEMARSCLSDSNCDLKLWAEAIVYAAYTRNHIVNKVTGKATPHELWSGAKPDVSHLRVFGSKGFVLDKRAGRHKFAEKGKEMIFVGYGDTSKAYRMLDPTSRNVVYSRDVRFIESEANINENGMNMLEDDEVPISFSVDDAEDDSVSVSEDNNVEELEDNPSTVESVVDQENTQASSQATSQVVKRKRGRPKKTDPPTPRPEWIPSNHRYLTRSKASRQDDSLAVIKEEKIMIPRDVTEALSSEHAEAWIEAMATEMASLMKNKTYDLVKLPRGRRSIGSRWVFAVKYHKDGSIDRFKARLVARGFSQRFGVDYNQTYSPTVRPESLRILFSLCVEKGYHIHQVDVSTAYLNGELAEEIYMDQPAGYVDKDHPEYVCRLNKSLYGLKQSGRQWNLKLHEILTEIGLHRLETERCLYKGKINGHDVLLAVYVDDLLIASDFVESIEMVKSRLGERIDISDKGPAKYILGIELERPSMGEIRLSQSYAITKLLESQRMTECKPIATPMEANVNLEVCDKDCEKVDSVKYRSLVGSLLHLSLNTRPDICFAVNRLAKFNQEPHVEHWNAARRVLRYLKGSINKSLIFTKANAQLVAYVDADWAADKADRKSCSGYCFMLSNACVAWASKKQSIVAQSTAESEYSALSEATNEATYLRQLIEEIGCKEYVQTPLRIFNDNTSAIKLTENPMFHKQTKHIGIRVHNVRQHVDEGKLKVEYMPTESMVADVLTKALSRIKHDKFITELGLREGVRD